MFILPVKCRKAIMTIKILTFLLMYMFLKSETVRDTEYCCCVCHGGKMHTICKYPKGGIGPSCRNYVRGPLNSSEKAAILKMHNVLRQNAANGIYKQHSPGANLLEMIWDDELEFIAKRWNDQCEYGHDDCRNSLRFFVGQNIAYSYTKTAESMVQFWFDEYLITPADQIDKLTKLKQFVTYPNSSVIERETGHFSQLVAAQSYRLGCNVMVQFEAPEFKITIMCSYGPTGNFLQKRVYKKGKACSSCPLGTTCSKEYPGLCKVRCSKIQPQYCAGANSIKPFWMQNARFIVLFVVFIFSV